MLIIASCGLAYGQTTTTILDFEDASTTTTFQSFGGAVEGIVRSPIENPDKTGLNTSDSVMMHVKPGDAPEWGGAFSNPIPATAVDLTTSGSMIKMKVWMPGSGGVVRFKLEESTTGAGNWELDATATTGDEWVELTWDPTTPSAAGDGVVAAGNSYNKVVVFFTFGTAGDGNDYTYYFDDVVVEAPMGPPPTSGPVTILDFEDAATTTTMQSFGGAVEGVVRSPIENPDKSGINTSDSVMIHIKPGDAPEWGGAFSNPVPMTPVNLTNDDTVSIKVWMPAAGVVRFKLEESTTGAGNWELDQTASAGMQWVELKYDTQTPSAAGDGVVAAGNIYNKVVVFFDFGTAGDGNEYTYYWDDLVVGTESGSVSIKDELVQNLFSIAPNPTRDNVTLSLEANPTNSSQVTITDLQGKVVYAGTVEAGVSDHQVRVADWAAGLYMVSLRTGNTIGVQKLLVE